MQKVELINYTENALRTMYTGCKTCYSETNPETIWENSHPIYYKDAEKSIELMHNLVSKILSAGHLSIAEHVNFTFAISGISRTLSHQFVRHRHATFSQKSQRYVSYHKPFGFITPETIAKNEELKQKYDLLMQNIQLHYDLMLRAGIPAEDARYIFPNACETSITMTCNFRELMHICNLRLCLRAQWEIREMVGKMRDEVVKVYPFMAEYLVPKCKTCTEYENCGRKKQ